MNVNELWKSFRGVVYESDSPAVDYLVSQIKGCLGDIAMLHSLDLRKFLLFTVAGLH